MALQRGFGALYPGHIIAPNDRNTRLPKRQPAGTGRRSTGAFGLIPVAVRAESMACLGSNPTFAAPAAVCPSYSARCAPKAQGERLSIVSPLVGETMDDAVPTGWRFGGPALQMHVAMTWPG
jgi:hypothetical protein